MDKHEKLIKKNWKYIFLDGPGPYGIPEHESFYSDYIQALKHPFESNCGDIEALVILEDGSEWRAWFFTMPYINYISQKDKYTGESGGGSYFWAINFVVIDNLSDSCVVKTVDDMLETMYFLDAFNCACKASKKDPEKQKQEQLEAVRLFGNARLLSRNEDGSFDVLEKSCD